MEFINAEEFLKQPKEVQKIFLDWWKPKPNDIVYVNPELGYNGIDMLVDYTFDSNENGEMIVVELMGCMSQIVIPLSKTTPSYMSFIENMKYITPLLTEGQLRKFIQDNTDKTMTLKINIWKYKTLVIEISLKDRHFDMSFKVYGRVIEAYWKVALEIAKEKVKA